MRTILTRKPAAPKSTNEVGHPRAVGVIEPARIKVSCVEVNDYTILLVGYVLKLFVAIVYSATTVLS